MTKREYAFRRGLTWQLWENIAMVTAPAVIVVVLGLLGLEFWTTLVLALCFGAVGAFIAWGNWWIFRNFAKRVLLDDEAIEARPFYGSGVRLGWDEIAVRQESERRDPFRGVFPQIRLVGSGGDRIVLDGEMTDSEELFAEIRARTLHASPGPERSWWERIFLPG